MPCDRNGLRLAVGDVVMVPCVVRAIVPCSHWRNLHLLTLEPCHPSREGDRLVLNSRQVERQARQEGDDE